MYNNQSSGFKEDFRGRGCGQRGRHFGGHGFPGGWGGHKGGRGFGPFSGFDPFSRFRRVPVNIEESDTSFIISLYASGLQKEAIKVTVKDDVLTISYKGNETGEPTTEERNYTRREFHNASFERQFSLNDKVITEDINAVYADGILTVTLPKNPETNKPAQDINVG